MRVRVFDIYGVISSYISDYFLLMSKRYRFRLNQREFSKNLIKSSWKMQECLTKLQKK